MFGRARLVTLSLLVLVAFAALAGARVDRAGAVSSDLFISEYIEGSGNNKAIEIFNGTGVPVNLNTGLYGLTMYFNGNPMPGLTISLNGTIAPGDVFVVAHTLADQTIRDQADQLTSAGIFNGNDAVAVRKGLALVDVIGQIGANPGDAGWGTDPTNTTDNTLRRKPTIEAGDTNGSDAFDPATEWEGFAVNNSAGLGAHTVTTGGDAAPSVSSTSPGNGATEVAQGANISVNFSEPVTAASGWYTISCSSTGVHTAVESGGSDSFTLDPDTDFGLGETCTVSVDATKVTDNDSDDPPDAMAANHTFSFRTTLPVTEIADVQGAAHISPLNGQAVKVEGVVTARRTSGGRGYWIQDPTPDENVATSDAVFVFLNQAPAAQIGALVRVVGTVGEFRAGNDPDNLTITQVNSSNANVTQLSTGNSIAPTVLGEGGRMAPTENIDDDGAGNVETGGVFDPVGDAIDFYESLEGVMLQVNDGFVVGATRSFGEITLLPDGGSWATGLDTPRSGILLGGYADPNPERITVDDEILRDLAPAPRPTKAMPDMNVGDELLSSVVGPLDYSFSNYKIQATTTPTFEAGGNVRETTGAPSDEEIVFGTFNVENLAGTDPQAKYDHLASLIVGNLKAPDVLGIEEVQDNDGTFDPPGETRPEDSTVVDADVAWNRLIAAIKAAGGPTYDYRQINPVDDADGGAPGGNIRVGFLFRTDRGVSFVDRPGGSPTTETSVAGKKHKPELSSSPGRIGTESEDRTAFADTRKSLAGEFDVRGRTVFAIVNHFSSKGDDQPLFGPAQPPMRFSEIARHGQAELVNDFVDDILARDESARIVVLGDINDFEFSETTDLLEGGVLTSLVKTLPENERYSYVFEGNSQVLDQILTSDRLLRLPYRPAYDIVHLNSEFADAVQASDHEPSVVRLKFGVEED